MKYLIVMTAVFASALCYDHGGYKYDVEHVYHPQINQHQEVVHQEAVQSSGDDHHHVEHYVDYVGHPKYHYDYAVHDPHTHDVKSQWEVRDGKHVKGEYSVVQPDGKTRIVKYESDGHGTNYDVKYVHGHHGGY